MCGDTDSMQESENQFYLPRIRYGAFEKAPESRQNFIYCNGCKSKNTKVRHVACNSMAF